MNTATSASQSPVLKRKNTLQLLRAAFNGWLDNNATTSSAALSYYSLFSIAPLLLISLAVAGAIFGADASQGQIYESVRGLLGTSGASAVQDLVKSASQKQNAGLIATVVGIVTLILGASSVFSQLQTSLNFMWRVHSKPGRGVWIFLRQRLLSFSMIVVIAFLLLLSLVVSAAVAAAGAYMRGRLPGGEVLWQAVNFSLSFGVAIALFAAIFKILPDVRLGWRDVWRGGLLTAALFTVGKLLIGLYIGKSGVTSSYGAAGSAVVLLLWSYYASAILFFGAEYTRAIAMDQQRVIEPKEGAEFIPGADSTSGGSGVGVPGAATKSEGTRSAGSNFPSSPAPPDRAKA